MWEFSSWNREQVVSCCFQLLKMGLKKKKKFIFQQCLLAKLTCQIYDSLTAFWIKLRFFQVMLRSSSSFRSVVPTQHAIIPAIYHKGEALFQLKFVLQHCCGPFSQWSNGWSCVPRCPRSTSSSCCCPQAGDSAHNSKAALGGWTAICYGSPIRFTG